jgi:pimeloyl-ACP methyl ester carboxylesterase
MRFSFLSRVLLVCVAVVTCADTVLANVGQGGSTLVVLVPGFLGHRDIPALGPYFPGFEEALQRDGFDVVTLVPPPVAGSEERGAWLAAAVDEVAGGTGDEHVIVIAHSQGGVDARAALDVGAPIDAVATLSSPHAGTDVADVARSWPRSLVGAALSDAGRGSQTLNNSQLTTPAPDDALASLSRDGMSAFNLRHPTSPVPLFSVAAFTGADVDDACRGGAWARPTRTDSIHPLLLAGKAMIRWSRNVSNDGVVPTRSMRFGTFLGCVAGDHADWLGWGIEEDDGAFDERAFIVELARGLDGVARSDARAMDAHVPRLASLAHTRPNAP